MFSPEMPQLYFRLRKELGFILDEAARSSTGMPSVPADIFHFSKAVFHPTTALCTPILTKPVRNFQMALGTYESPDRSYQGFPD
jgi:hypothetical protein